MCSRRNTSRLLFIIVVLNAGYSIADAPKENLLNANQLKNHGKYLEAIDSYKKLASSDESSIAETARKGWLECLLLTGKYGTLLELGESFRARSSKDPQIEILMAKSFMSQGKYQDAEGLLRQAANGVLPSKIDAQVELALVLKFIGRLAESLKLLASASDAMKDQNYEPSKLKAIVLHNLGRFREANSFFKKATVEHPDDLETWILWGYLLLEKYNVSDAASVFSDVLKQNPNHPEALVGLALASREEAAGEVETLLNRAIQTNPYFDKAYVAKAQFDIESENYEAAENDLQKCFAINPKCLKALGLQAVLGFAKRDKHMMESSMYQAFQVNPSYGELYEFLGHFAVMHRLYDESVEFFQKAIQKNPRLWTAHAALGVNLLRIGNEQDAKRILQNTFDNDPYNLWAYNTLKLLDSYKYFESSEDDHFTLRLHKKEAALLKPYVSALLEEVFATLSTKYKYVPNQRIYFEMFPDHDDFAVRALGIPGLGALGVCFGNGIVMDSPSARPTDQFNWGKTLWHEFTHVITLGITAHNVPRWFTEGLSVMEERLAKPGWSEEPSLEIIKAIQDKKLLPIMALDAGFLRPRFPGQVQLSYFQAGQACEMIAQEYGFGAIQQMLQLFASLAPLPDVLGAALRLTPEAFDSKFRAFLDTRYGSAIRGIDFSFRSQKEPYNDPQKLLSILNQDPDNFFANLWLASYHRSHKEDDRAIACLKRVKSVFPGYVEEDNPYRQLAEIYLEKGLIVEATEELRDLSEKNDRDTSSLKLLSEWLGKTGRFKEAIESLEKAIFIDPFDSETHQRLAELTLQRGINEIALREFTALLYLNPGDPADAHFQLARVLLKMGRKGEAKNEILKSLEIAPTFEQGQKLLLEILETPENSR